MTLATSSTWNQRDTVPTLKKKSNYSLPYINQFPSLLHPYIMQVQDVKPDGNCGFRAVSVCRGYDEDQWPTIPMDLLQELQMYADEYKIMFGNQNWLQTYNSLNFFRTDMFAPMQH